MMSFLPMRLVLAALLLAPIASAHAEKADKDKPINFSSDQGGANYESKTGSLRGNVVLTQGRSSAWTDGMGPTRVTSMVRTSAPALIMASSVAAGTW